MLRRLGNKTRLLPKLLELFPEHITTFIDMFMGSGAVTFAMVDRAKSCLANDKDSEIFNLFLAVKEHKDELIQALSIMPIHEKLWKYWKTQNENDCVWRASRFLLYSNFSYMGKGETLLFEAINQPKRALLSQIDNVFEKARHVKFLCCDFRDVLKKISWKKETFDHKAYYREESFVYADPPYIGTNNNYQESFTEQDTQDLFELLTGSGIRFALSEFDNPFVLELAGKHGLRVTEIGERQNLKNRRTEILITNYDVKPLQTSLF